MEKTTIDLEKFFELNHHLIPEQYETPIEMFINYKVIDCFIKNEKIKDYTNKIGQIVKISNFSPYPNGFVIDENENIYLEKDLRKI